MYYAVLTNKTHHQLGFMVVDKSSGISIHNDPSFDLVSMIKRDFPQFDPAPCHRLDRGTSGIVIFGLNKETTSALGGMFIAGQITKQYLAIVKGVPKSSAGLWRYPLSQKSESRKNPRGKAAERVPCKTAWTLLKTGDKSALLCVSLETGRKHQIRRHAAIAGHGLIGDDRYGTIRCSRLCLHAGRIGFEFKGNSYEFVSWPKLDFWENWRGEQPDSCFVR